jgi:hypothetical protein
MAALAQWRIQAAGKFLLILVWLVDLEVSRSGVIEDQIDIEAEQVGGFEEYLAFASAQTARKSSAR